MPALSHGATGLSGAWPLSRADPPGSAWSAGRVCRALPAAEFSRHTSPSRSRSAASSREPRRAIGVRTAQTLAQHPRRRLMKAVLAMFWIALLAIATPASAQPVPSLADWPSLAGDEAKTGTRRTEIAPFAEPRWLLSQTPAGEAIHFVGPAGVAATAHPEPRVFTAATIAGQARAVAVDAETGEIVWTTPIPALILDSWACPTIDPASGVVLYATGSSVVALHTADGSLAWQTDLNGPPVNVSPLVTRDLAPRNRAFVSDYGGFGGPSWLYCINISPHHPTLNPFQPGEIVWAAHIGSSTGGTPAYLDGVVYVCSTGIDFQGFAEIRAFDAQATEEPEPLWTFTNPIAEGFFSGLTVRETTGGLFLYAATYAFYGQLDSANLVKIHARSGQLAWSVPSNRTSSIPIVLDDGRVVLSTGIQGFGSVPMIQMFEDHGSYATQLWNTAHATWNDLNNNGQLDPGEFLLVGGWNTHPVLTHARTPDAAPRLLVGAIPAGNGFAPYTDLYELDLSKAPADPGFIVQHTTHAGSTPAMLGSGVYSVGTGGLAALGPPPPNFDVNNDGQIDLDDLYAWEQGQGDRDINRDAVTDHHDRELLIFELRRNEVRDMNRGRR
ncbi:MAG: hypothetical protein EA378_01090 [Phycisphaerales bacterium]|nr:MAG: hypothetical protein EA378_01090 [Phycisphaerales bacterium]